MLDKHIEPDAPYQVEYRCECGECEGCCGNWEWLQGGITLERAIMLAEFNYECKVYNELEKQKPEW